MTLSLGLTDLQVEFKPTEVNKGLFNSRLQIRTLLPDSSLTFSYFIEILHQCKAMKEANVFPVFREKKKKAHLGISSVYSYVYLCSRPRFASNRKSSESK